MDDQQDERYEPRLGPAEDPWEDDPEGRARQLAPLRGVDGSVLARLRLGGGAEKVDFLLALPDAEEVVQALAPDEFALLVAEVGLNDAPELVALASPRQLQATVDLDAWHDGELDGMTVGHWLQVALEAGGDTAARWVAAQEDALLALYLAQTLLVIPREVDEAPEIPEGREVFDSPDGTLVLAARPDDPQLASARALVDLLFEEGVERGRTVLHALRWELPAQLADDVLRLRHARLQEMGFADRDEARTELYVFEDPHATLAAWQARWRGTAGTTPGLQPYLAAADDGKLGLALAEPPAGGLLAQAMAQLTTEERARLHDALVRLTYQVQSARADKPTDLEVLPRWARHTLTTLTLGLAAAAEEDVAYASVLLRVTPVAALFRVGHGLRVIEHHRARRLRQRLGGDAGLARLQPDEQRLVRALLLPMPEVADTDDPLPALRAVADQLRGLHATASLVLQLIGGEWTAAPPGASLQALLATALARAVIGQPPTVQPLERAQLQDFLRRAIVDGRLRPELRATAVRALMAQPGLDDAEAAALGRFAEAALDRVGEELGGLDPERPIDLRFAGRSVLVAGQS
jgi:hypothetical protein